MIFHNYHQLWSDSEFYDVCYRLLDELRFRQINNYEGE